MNLENCAKNWLLLFELIDSNTLLGIASLYGDTYAIEAVVEIHRLNEAGEAIYKRKNEKFAEGELSTLVKDSWNGMRLEISRFLLNEDEAVTAGAIKHCESLKLRKYKYEQKGVFNYPIFSL